MRFSTLHRPARWLSLTAVAVMVTLPPLLNNTHADDQQNTQTPGRAADKTEESAARSNSEHADDESPSLGVIVGSCPGNAVCVRDTVWGSPAAEADIRQGVYILSVEQVRPNNCPKAIAPG